eukprot:scaffold84451_cov16-Tisochrysis_lutea.AAC.2
MCDVLLHGCLGRLPPCTACLECTEIPACLAALELGDHAAQAAQGTADIHGNQDAYEEAKEEAQGIHKGARGRHGGLHE